MSYVAPLSVCFLPIWCELFDCNMFLVCAPLGGWSEAHCFDKKRVLHTNTTINCDKPVTSSCMAKTVSAKVFAFRIGQRLADNMQRGDNLVQGSPNYVPEAKSGPRSHFVNEKNVCEKFVDLVKCNIIRNNHITWDIRPSNCCVIASVALWQKTFGDPWILVRSVSVLTDTFQQVQHVIATKLYQNGTFPL